MMFIRSFSAKSKKKRIVDNSILVNGKPITKGQNSVEGNNDTLLIDEAGKASTEDYLVVGSYIKQNNMKAYRNVKKAFPKKDNGQESKYSNTSADERIKIYRELDGIPYEIWDSSEASDDLQLIKDVVQKLIGDNSLPDNQVRYIYRIYNTIRDVMESHNGKMDITIDNPPFKISEELRKMCKTLISQNYPIVKYTVRPSRVIIELQVHDFVAGLDKDIRDDYIEKNPNISDSQEMKTLIERFKKRFKSKRFP